MLKSWLSRLRIVTGNRRIKPRFKPRPGPPIIASIALVGKDTDKVAGHVRDLSESGLSFFILDSLAAQIGLLIKGAKCRVVLALPTGAIYLFGELVWCQVPDADKAERGGVMAIQITEINQDAKEQYLTYLRSLG
ncbi:MAG: PilZ domain-containing protein [Acidobacteria bacterium]|nr:PilZ domain-containing protein [Acidobacteriota bacterium]